MGKSRRRVFYLVAALVLLIALVVVPACAPKEAAPPKTVGGVPADAAIKVVELTDFTGPTALTEIMMTNGSADYFKYINEQGGIPFTYQGKNYKVKINHEPIDTRYEVALGVSAYKRTIVDKPHFYITLKSDHADVLAEPASKDKVVIMAWGIGTGKSIYTPGWVFGTMPPYSETGGSQVDYLLTQHKESRPLKIAFLTWDNASGRGLITDEMMAYCKKKGVDVVGTWFYPVAPVDITAILSQIAEKKPDAILLCGGMDSAVVVLKDAKRVGLSKAGGGNVTFYTYFCTIDWQLFDLVGDAAEQSVVTYSQYAGPNETNIPAVQVAVDNAKKYRNDKLYFTNAIGTASARVIVAAAQKALETKGWPVTGADMYDAVQTLTGNTLDGMVGPLGFSSTQRLGLNQLRQLGVKGGKPVFLNDWAKAPLMKPGTWTSGS